MKLEIYKDTYKTEYRLNGLLHREDGPAVECISGETHWRIHGILHREDGPAVELSNGSAMWYVNGLLHRTTGPAIEHHKGYDDWYIRGNFLTSEITQWFKSTGFNPNHTTWTSQEKLQFKLIWG